MTTTLSTTSQAQAPSPAANATAQTAAARSSTPATVKRLRRLRIGAVALLLTFGTLITVALGLSYSSALGAQATLTQYYRLADAQVQALTVQQTANTWPLGGSDGLRSTIETRLGEVAGTLAEAASETEDRARIAPISAALVRYAMTLQDAINAEGTESAAILARADQQLTNDVIKPLHAAKVAAGDRLAGEMNSGWTLWVYLAAAVTAAGLVAVLVALARSSHRYVNVGVALGLVSALISALVAGAAIGNAANAGGEFNSSTRPSLDSVSLAGQQINQARADELLAVGLRADGRALLTRFATGYEAARNALTSVTGASAARSSLTSYNSAHQQVASALNGSQWDTARSLVISTGPSGRGFTSADRALTTLTERLRDPATTDISQPADNLASAIGVSVLLTLIGAGMAAWGVARRLEEYR